MVDVHKKHTKVVGQESPEEILEQADEGNAKPEDAKTEESKSELAEALDTVTEPAEKNEATEEATPKPKSEAKKEEKSEEKSSAEATLSAASSDPLTDFKEKMNEEEETSVSNQPPKKNYMWPILFIFIIALVILGGVFVYRQGVNKKSDVNVVTLSPTPTVVPSPTIALDLSKYPIEVLNGSEVGGEAGRQKANLEGKGFTVASVGNADNSDYTKTIIQAKENVDKAFLDKLKSVLEESFVVGEVEVLPEDADSDVIVIIGSETN